MAYIHTKHRIGDIVYLHDAATDSVQRLRIVGMRASTTDTDAYAGMWHVHYIATAIYATEPGLTGTYSSDDLHISSSFAFPVPPPDAEPVRAVLAEAAE